MSPLQTLLDQFRSAAQTNREAGTYFEELTVKYLQNEPIFKELYKEVLTYAAWASQQGIDKRDTGIDLVAETHAGEVHAVQCKLYPSNHRVQKSDIDSFLAASGKKPFAQRLLVVTSENWSEHAEDSLRDQQPPVSKLDLATLEGSLIDWATYAPGTSVELRVRKTPRPHQVSARDQVIAGLAEHDRGQLIMACGTGKTYTSLQIAEVVAGAGKRVLFLVPSLALLSQTLTEWTQEAKTPLLSFAVCSDSDVGKKRKKDDDVVETHVHELHFPATTNADRLAKQVAKQENGEHMTVVFATYHSIDVVHRAQHDHGLGEFDLVICDEAHRTTGATFESEEESNFVRVHDAAYIRSKKRLYMTATPKIFGEGAKIAGGKSNTALCSMDDPALYGPILHLINFSQAVKRGLLVDYKVIVLAVEESHVSRRIQDLLKDENNQLRMDDAAKIVGCWKALAKQGLHEGLSGDTSPMKRAVAFCQVIERNAGAKTHKVSSKHIAEVFASVVKAYQDSAPADEDTPSVTLACQAKHVDGSMNASVKNEKINWLKADAPENTSRILSNVRCLSEGVDVPALDAVLFLTPRNSQIDVVQSVGRVMRTASGKKRGYIVLPVVIPAGVQPHEALNDNQTYKVVWQVLQALRSHDDRFDAMVNKLELDTRDPSKMEVIAITDKIAKRPKTKKGDGSEALRKGAKAGTAIGTAVATKLGVDGPQHELALEIGEIERAIYAKLVEKVGNRHHWEDWAKDIAKIGRTHIDRITGILENAKNTREREAFDRFAEELRDDLNDSITRDEVIEMLAQHLVTKPVFEALFSGHSFAAENAMSRAMQGVLDALHEHHLEKETDTLQTFYDSVKLRAEGIESAAGKQKIILELYDKFFETAFPTLRGRLGIVYTPVEIVDFILKSVDHLLRTEFGQTLGSEGVHIIDPFTGTGTFVTRLMQSGLISREELVRKYASEIHANEIVLLAYYIAAINIEAAYHGIVGGTYTPFEGICLTDTFQLYEKDDLISRLLVDNSARRTRQKKLDIRVVIGNPPYSDGQDSANDLNDNMSYPMLDARIRDTYAARSDIRMVRSLYNSYIRAIRWASDRMGDAGVIGFVTNAGFLSAISGDGLRRCLADEFTSLYIFNLRGNQRTRGEVSRREGGKVFDSGSRAPVAISLLVKNPASNERGQIWFREVDDYLSAKEKLESLTTFASIAGITEASGWTRISPDNHGDWLRQRDAGFDHHIALGDKSRKQRHLFETFSNGAKSNRDAWVFNPSLVRLRESVSRMTTFFNAEAARLAATRREGEALKVDSFIRIDLTQISWADDLKRALAAGRTLEVDPGAFVTTLYRPFAKQFLYMDKRYLWSLYLLPSLFPRQDGKNRLICLSGPGNKGNFSALLTDAVPSMHVADIDGSQCFPLYVYDENTEDSQGALFAGAAGSRRRDGITDPGLAHFQSAYPGETITKEDVFYYVYGILHSPDYRERYADNLGKELPRIPRMKTAADFWTFSRAGRALGELHVAYESQPEYGARVEEPSKAVPGQYRVEKMKFGKGKDKTVVHYNDLITVRDIPLAAYEYVVNGKPAIEWVMERQSVTTDKDSGIVKDANAWATETVGDARYPLSLLLRVITVSLETMTIVRSLPALDILEEADAAAPANEARVPFRRVTPTADEKYKTCVPFVPLSAAAGGWSETQEGVPELDDAAVEWITWEDAPRFAEGMFVAQVTGRSMEPGIPDGAYCLFRRVSLPSSAERPVLVRHGGAEDPETGGQYTVKLYREEKAGRATRIALSPTNAEFEPLLIARGDAGSVRVLAEVVAVLAVGGAG